MHAVADIGAGQAKIAVMADMFHAAFSTDLYYTTSPARHGIFLSGFLNERLIFVFSLVRVRCAASKHGEYQSSRLRREHIVCFDHPNGIYRRP
ncbi:MAG TPA: hypothetical protein DC017_13845 [Candidatus Wallbacteria bacterium]|nr:hypothetical protein [Candidatus Wallbacteria bacterium]